MRRRGVPADEVTMNSIIDGLVSCAPPRVREAETLLALMSGWGLKPNQASKQAREGALCLSCLSSIRVSCLVSRDTWCLLAHWRAVPAVCHDSTSHARWVSGLWVV